MSRGVSLLESPSNPPEESLEDRARSLAATRPFPIVASKVRELVANPRTQLADVARAVESDLGIATDILRLANAAATGLTQKCASVRQATALLGLRRVCDIVDAAAALAVVEGCSQRAPTLVSHALGVAGVARMIAPLTGISPDEAYTLGLLHDVAILLLIQSGDVFYESYLHQAEDNTEGSAEEERMLMGFDHAELGGAVLREWNLPPHLAAAVSLHHDWPRALEAGGHIAAQVAILRASEALIPWLSRRETPSVQDLEPLVQEPSFEHLGLSRQELLGMWDGLKRASTSKSSTSVAPSGGDAAPAPVPPPALEPRDAIRPPADGPKVPPAVLAAAAAAALAVGALVFYACT